MIWRGLALGLLVALLSGPLAVAPALAEGHGGGHGGGEAAKPPEGGEAKAEAKKPAKPKPKRPNKDKNCGWDREVDIVFDIKHLKLTQAAIRGVMRGVESEQDGYTFYADADKLLLKIKSPEGIWYIADMSRLGDLDEGCVFYYVGEPKQIDSEPPLF